MTRLTYALFFSVALYPSFLAGQVSPGTVDTLTVSSSTIYLQSTFLGGNKYVQNGEVHPAGGSFGKLRDRLASVPEAYGFAEYGSKLVTYGRVVSLVGAAMGATTLLVHGDVLNYGLSFGGFAVASVGGAIQMKGRNRINKAVWLYNISEVRVQESELE